VPCGRCNYCLQTKRSDWSTRLEYEHKKSDYAYFITLTYSPEHLSLDPVSGLPTLVLEDLQLFKKRLRKAHDLSQIAKGQYEVRVAEKIRASGEIDYVQFKVASGKRIRYYSVGEYGTLRDRPHYHSIMFNLEPDVADRIGDIWGLGSVRVDPCTPASISYTTKYVINKVEQGATCPVMRLLKTREPPFAVMSRRPGLGAGYVGPMAGWHRASETNYIRVDGVPRRMPRYWKEKIFTDLERAKMAVKSQSHLTKQYRDEIDRLSLYEREPESYYEQREAWHHEQIFKKLNDKNKL